jgi:hypothetical protein
MKGPPSWTGGRAHLRTSQNGLGRYLIRHDPAENTLSRLFIPTGKMNTAPVWIKLPTIGLSGFCEGGRFCHRHLTQGETRGTTECHPQGPLRGSASRRVRRVFGVGTGLLYHRRGGSFEPDGHSARGRHSRSLTSDPNRRFRNDRLSRRLGAARGTSGSYLVG